MTDRAVFENLVGPEEGRRVFGALQRGASRRDVLTMLLAGGLQAGVAGSVATLATEAHAQTPRKGGRITVAATASGVNDTLDPARQSGHIDYCRGFMFYNGLTVLDSSLTPRPQLAEEFTTQDAKTWVFKLRKGVSFHDGKPLTPADVVFSIMRHKDAATTSRAKVLADPIESVTASGPNEVTIRLVSSNADLPAILGTYHFHIVKEGTTDFSAGIGTGPRGETDAAKRAQMYADMQVMIHNEGGIGIPMFISSLDGHTSRLKGLTPVPIGGMMGASFAEHVWLEA
jgi:peptide/nickel transport system substrate-binding protein